jgi:hypothetical protein
MKAIKKVYPTEHAEQSSFVQWMKYQHPAIRFFAIPNGVRTGFKQALKIKREGGSPGIPDLYFPFWKIWIEFKRVKGGSVSFEQKEWHQYLEDHCGDKVIIAKGCDDAIKQLMAYLTRNKNN